MGCLIPGMRGKCSPEHAPRALVALAERQDGVIGRAQVRAAGFNDGAIDRLITRGWLIPIHYGVFALGHRPRTLRGWHFAALIAAGPRAALSHRSSGAHLGMAETASRVHVIAPRSARGVRGIVVHRPRGLLEGDIVTEAGLRTTSPGRTLLDLAAISSRRTLERALDQAEIRRLHLPIDEVRSRAWRRRGAPLLRAVLDWHIAGTTISESEAEEAFLVIVRRAGIPPPVLQFVVNRKRRDFAWPAQRVVVEVDSRGFHDTMAAFERDRERDAELVVAGWTPLRFTRRRIVFEPSAVECVLLQVLGCISPGMRG